MCRSGRWQRINRIEARKTDSNNLCRKVKDTADTDYLGMDTDREQHKLVHWRHSRLEAQRVDMDHCTDRSHSHKPGQMNNVRYNSIPDMYLIKHSVQLSLISNAAKVSLKYAVYTDTFSTS